MRGMFPASGSPFGFPSVTSKSSTKSKRRSITVCGSVAFIRVVSGAKGDRIRSGGGGRSLGGLAFGTLLEAPGLLMVIAESEHRLIFQGELSCGRSLQLVGHLGQQPVKGLVK